MPSTPPAASVPVDNAPEYPARRSSGSATFPIVEAVASEDPQTAPNPAQAAMAAIAVPPRNRPNHALAPRKRLALRPEALASAPMSTNIGTTDRS